MRNLAFITFRDLALYLKSKGRYSLHIPAEYKPEMHRDTNRGISREMRRNRCVGYNHG